MTSEIFAILIKYAVKKKKSTSLSLIAALEI